MTAPLWTPSAERKRGTQLWAFAARNGIDPDDYPTLHRWSVTNRAAFWPAVWEFCGVIGDKPGPVLIDGDAMPGARFFPDATLNFAENLLRRTGPEDALVFRGEDGLTRRWSWDRLIATVSRLQQALLDVGLASGDRVAGIVPNAPETVAMMLATVSLGGVWSSCSPDFGARGILDRFAQIAPTLVVGVDGYDYGGKHFDTRTTLQEVVIALAPRAVWRLEQLDDIMAPYSAQPLRFPRLPFTHPLFVMFSSGTTGKPKCIVHSAGGTLLQHLKEHRLHCDIRSGDRVFYFTTCGWMMWNWLVSALGSGATLCLYDGSPFYPNAQALLAYAEDERFTLLGTSARMIDAWRRLGIRAPALPALRSLLSTGSPLGPEGFNYVYAKLKADLHLASISGGTDIISCFVLGVPTQPVFLGEIQAPGLGMEVSVFGADGAPLADGKGELVCTAAFPSMPTGFWNDPDGRHYRTAYFGRFPGVWAHGDFAQWMPNGGIAILGRSDATLNPGGVRIGTAEIYAVLDALPEIDSALCVGQGIGSDTRIVLFIVLASGAVLDDVLVKRIKTTIRTSASPRHVPARIIAVADLPRTRSGKITEVAVREVIHGRSVQNIEALANPESLNLFRDLPSLKD